MAVCRMGHALNSMLDTVVSFRKWAFCWQSQADDCGSLCRSHTYVLVTWLCAIRCHTVTGHMAFGLLCVLVLLP